MQRVKRKLKGHISKFLLRSIVYFQQPSWQRRNVYFVEPTKHVDQEADISHQPHVKLIQNAKKLRRLSLKLEEGYLAVQPVGLNINQTKTKVLMYYNTCTKIATRPIRKQQPEDPKKSHRSLCFEKIWQFVMGEIGNLSRRNLYRKDISIASMN